MNGFVDHSGRALLDVQLRPADNAKVSTVRAWIDTGFTGDLVLPQELIQRLQLPQSGTVSAVLADGSQVAMRTYTCSINWFGQTQQLQVVSNAGEYPLLGVGLLLNRDLGINYQSCQITIN